MRENHIPKIPGDTPYTGHLPFDESVADAEERAMLALQHGIYPESLIKREKRWFDREGNEVRDTRFDGRPSGQSDAQPRSGDHWEHH